ncbi:energy-coupled thiamine transporter ThiT [Guggenheimella bovis]
MDTTAWFKENPTSLVFIVILLIASILLIRTKRIRFSAKLIAEMGVCVALSVILNMFPFHTLPQGGSITVASMAPIILLALAWGGEVGLLAGFAFGILNMIFGGYIVHWAQLLLDYPLAFMFIGIAGYFPKHMNLGVILATLLRLSCHVLSGVIFFKEYAGDQNPLLYSLSYNGSFLGIDLIIVLVVLNLLPISRLVKALNSEAPEIKR